MTRDADTPTDNTSTARRPDVFGLVDDLIMALRFFSRLPTPGGPHEAPDLDRIAMVLPVAALLMGVIPASVIALGAAVGLPAYFVAALAVASMLLVGGGMMEDGLADAFDGLFGAHTKHRRLEIMKDSRHGTYGVAALCLLLVLRVTAIGSVAGTSAWSAAGLWLAANMLGRSGSLWLSVTLPPARPDGAAAAAGSLAQSRFLIGAAVAVALALPAGILVSGIAGTTLAVILAGLAIAGWARLCKRYVGGQTGDLVGAAAALGEIAALGALLIFA